MRVEIAELSERTQGSGWWVLDQSHSNPLDLVKSKLWPICRRPPGRRGPGFKREGIRERRNWTNEPKRDRGATSAKTMIGIGFMSFQKQV